MQKEYRIIPDKFRFLSGSMIKLIAVITMLIDHTACYFFTRGEMPYTLMRGIGRIAFPIFAFLLAEGFIYTRNRLKYGTGLLICAVLSELPFNLVHTGTVFYYEGQNVFFTLFFGFLGMCVITYIKKYPLLQIACLIALGVAAALLNTDYKVVGVAFILLMFALRENELVRPFAVFMLGNSWWALGAFVPISFYNGKRGFIKGPVLKYAFYAFYPVHLFVMYLIKYRVFFR